MPLLISRLDESARIGRIEVGMNGSSFAINVLPEALRLCALIGMSLVILCGVVLTKLFGHMADEMTETFGYDNACVYFDLPPSTYVLPLLYVPFVTVQVLYCFMEIVRARDAYEGGELSLIGYRFLFTAHSYVAFSVWLFLLIFTIHPNGTRKIITLHSLPFVNLEVAFLVLQWAVAYFGLFVIWKREHAIAKWYVRQQVWHTSSFKISATCSSTHRSQNKMDIGGLIAAANVVTAVLLPLLVLAYFLFPYTWRPGLRITNRACPSVIRTPMSFAFIFFLLVAWINAPEIRGGTAASRVYRDFIAGLFRRVIIATCLHSTIAYIRIVRRRTICKWQGLVLCEIDKGVVMVGAITAVASIVLRQCVVGGISLPHRRVRHRRGGRTPAGQYIEIGGGRCRGRDGQASSIWTTPSAS